MPDLRDLARQVAATDDNYRESKRQSIYNRGRRLVDLNQPITPSLPSKSSPFPEGLKEERKAPTPFMHLPPEKDEVSSIFSKGVEALARVVETVFAPMTITGMGAWGAREAVKQAKEEEAWKTRGYVTETTPTAEIPPEWKVGGQKYEEYKALPLWQQLVYESPAWAALSAIPASALASWRAAGEYPTAAKIAVRTAVAPLAGYEWTIGKTTDLAYRSLMSAMLKRNLRSWAKSVGKDIPKATEDAFVKGAVNELSPAFLTKQAVKTLFKPTKGGFVATEAGAKAADNAAREAVRKSPLLLGKVPEVKPEVPKAPVTPEVARIPTTPTEQKVIQSITESKWNGFSNLEKAEAGRVRGIAPSAFRTPEGKLMSWGEMPADLKADLSRTVAIPKAGMPEAVKPPAIAGIKPVPEIPPEALKPTEGVVSPEVIGEDLAVAEVAGVPPKPPKDWDKVGGQLYDRFRKQSAQPTPNTVPLADRTLRLWGKVEKVTTDEFAKLNWLGWQAEVDVAMVRASGGQSAEVYRGTMKLITKSLGNDSNLLSYVDDYLMLRHQIEILKATGRKYFTIKRGDLSQRFTIRQIGLLFRQMKVELGAENYARVKEAASQIPAVYNQILKGTEELIPEQIEGLIKKYPWYNPVLFEKEASPINITRKMSPRQIKQLTTLEPSKEQITPLLSLPTTIARRMRAQAVNTARKSIAELAVDPKNVRLIGGDVEIVTKKPEGAFVDYFDNGMRKYLKLGKGSEWIAKDIELFQRQPPAMMIKMVRSLQNLSKMFFTTYNPGFVAWNTAFDGMVAYFAEGIGPWGFGKTLAGNIKGMFMDVPGLNEFRRSGGELFGFFEKGSQEGLGLRETTKAISSYITREKGRLVLRNPESLKRFINPFTLIRELGIAGENAARRATYEKAIKEGVTAKEATLRSRRVTVDFSRFSTASRVINDWFIYFNPAMQGFLLPARAVAKNPHSLWRLATLVAGYIGLTFYNQSYDEYKDVRDFDKVGKLLIMLPSNEYNKYGQKVPHYLTLLPFREFALFTAPIEYFMGRLRTEEPEAYRTIGQEWGVLYPVVSPLSMISESGGLVMPTQIGATIQQIIQNHDDFRDRPIIDDDMLLLPDAQQYDQYTNTLAIKIGQALNMSPKKLDFFVSNMFGALGNDSLRSIDLAIQGLDKEKVDERIATLVNQLRAIQTTVPPNQIEVVRETFLEGLSSEDRELVLNMERLPDDDFPFMQSLVRRFIRDYGGQVYATAKERALTNRTLEDYPPKALEELQRVANENAENFLKGKITKREYDDNRTRYKAFYSGASTAEWREGMVEGAVARADVEKFMPEDYQRSEEFQAVSAYMEIRQKYIDKAGGVLNSEVWGEIESNTLTELRRHYSSMAVQYAIDHKDDWIDKLPEPARTIERQRAMAIEDESWWDDYRGTTPKPKPFTPKEKKPKDRGRSLVQL